MDKGVSIIYVRRIGGAEVKPILIESHGRSWQVSHNFLLVEGADDFIGNRMDMLVPVITLETVNEFPWTQLE